MGVLGMILSFLFDQCRELRQWGLRFNHAVTRHNFSGDATSQLPLGYFTASIENFASPLNGRVTVTNAFLSDVPSIVMHSSMGIAGAIDAAACAAEIALGQRNPAAAQTLANDIRASVRVAATTAHEVLTSPVSHAPARRIEGP